MTDSNRENQQASLSSKTQLQGIKEAVDAAAIALPVLFTMCSAAGLKAGAVAADEILGSIKWAQKELAHMMTATPEPRNG